MVAPNEVKIRVRSNALDLIEFTVEKMRQVTGLNPVSIRTELTRMKRAGYLTSKPLPGARSGRGAPPHLYRLTDDEEKLDKLFHSVEAFYQPPGPARFQPTGRHYEAARTLLDQLEGDQAPRGDHEATLDRVAHHLELVAADEGVTVRELTSQPGGPEDGKSEVVAAYLALLHARLAIAQGGWSQAESYLAQARSTFTSYQVDDGLEQADTLSNALALEKAMADVPDAPSLFQRLLAALQGQQGQMPVATARRLLERARAMADAGPKQMELENLPCGVIISNAQGKVNRINAAAASMLGLDPEKLGRNLDHAVQDPRWQEALNEFQPELSSIRSTILRVGSRVLRATISPLTTLEEGKTTGNVTILYDITEEAKSQQSYNGLMASLSQELRTPMTSITGYTDLLLSKPSVAVMSHRQREFMQQIKANTERIGSMLNDLISVTAIDTEQLEIRLAMLDMAEVIENTLIETRARLFFVTSLAQGLRTSIASIASYIDLLLGESIGILNEIQRKFLQRIKASVERMDRMLNDLISISAIDAGQLEIRPAELDMAKVIEDTIAGVRAQLEEKELTLKLNLLEQMIPVKADPRYARQIMTNLLGNATKASPVGSTMEIATALREGNAESHDEGTGAEKSFLQISVRDSGGGIAPQDLEQVFERFHHAEHPLIKGLGENGAGLAIVKSLVEAHGGQVWAETEIGQGSTFYVCLPLIHRGRNDRRPPDLRAEPLG